MALPPDSGDSFLREVDENLRRDQARDFAKNYAPWLVLAFLLFLAAIGGYLYWQHRQHQLAAERSERLAAIFRDIQTPAEKNVPQRLEQLADGAGDATRASALFAKAAVALEQNDRQAAIAEFAEIASDEGLPEAYRHLATIRKTTLEFDALKPEEVIARLQPLSQPGSPWFGSAGELTALAMLKQGKKAEAGRLFASIAADTEVPETIRSRAVQIAGTLGVDASASMPVELDSQGQ